MESVTPPPLPADAPPAAGTTPRAFAQGTGLVLQTVGVILALASCCVCSLLGVYDPPPPAAARPAAAHDASAGQRLGRLFATPATAGLSLTVVGAAVGGLALATFGLGLQSEQRRSAWGALASVTALLAVMLAAGAGLWIGGAALLTRLINLALVLVLAVLMGFCVAALRQMRRHPPPPGLGDVPRDFDASMYRRH